MNYKLQALSIAMGKQGILVFQIAPQRLEEPRSKQIGPSWEVIVKNLSLTGDAV